MGKKLQSLRKIYTEQIVSASIDSVSILCTDLNMVAPPPPSANLEPLFDGLVDALLLQQLKPLFQSSQQELHTTNSHPLINFLPKDLGMKTKKLCQINHIV